MVRKGCILFLLASTLAIAQATLDGECSAADESCSATVDDNLQQHNDQPGEEASSPVTNEECKDTDDRCAFWASSGECTANPN